MHTEHSLPKLKIDNQPSHGELTLAPESKNPPTVKSGIAPKLNNIRGSVKMNFASFFSEQARKPTGLFGRLVMSTVFNIGNAKLNRFVSELMSVQEGDHVLEIGFGTGKLIYEMAKQIDIGLIEGVDFSSAMVAMAQKKNQKHIAKGKVKIQYGNFDEMSFVKKSFTKVCAVNVIYFWPQPEITIKKIADIVEDRGKLVLAFVDIARLERRRLSDEIFRCYSKDDVLKLLTNSGFSGDIRIESRGIRPSVLHCAIATK